MARFKGYEPDPAGLREIGRSTALGEACLAAARRGADFANSVDPGGKYQASPQVIPGGWAEEPRQGAVVEEGEPGAGNLSTRALARSVNVIEEF